MITAGTAQRLGDLTGLHVRNDIGEHRRQLTAGTPAEITAAQCLTAGGFGGSQLGEIGALLDLLAQAVGLGARGLDLVRRRLLGQCHQQVGQMVLDVAADILLVEIAVYLTIGDPHPAGDAALLDLLHQQLTTHLIAHLGQ